MTNDAIIKLDQGGINARILAKVEKADFRRIETASRKIPTTFSSPEAKRLFLRYFNSLQLNMHFISVIARTRLPNVAVEEVENSILKMIEKHKASVNQAIIAAESLCENHGITSLASYDTEPLTIEVRVTVRSDRDYYI